MSFPEMVGTLFLVLLAIAVVCWLASRYDRLAPPSADRKPPVGQSGTAPPSSCYSCNGPIAGTVREVCRWCNSLNNVPVQYCPCCGAVYTGAKL